MNEKKKIDLTRHGGGKSRVVSAVQTDTPVRELGAGTYGRVEAQEYEVEMDQHGRAITLAVKMYDNPGDAKRAYEHYAMCREKGLRVPTTYRLGEDSKTTYATELTRNGTYVAESYNSLNHYDTDHAKISGIENLIEFAGTLRALAQEAARKHVHLPQDSFFFIIPAYEEPTDVPVDVIIGDFDKVVKSGDSFENLYAHNLNAAVLAFGKWLRRRVEEQATVTFNVNAILSDFRKALFPAK